MYVNMIGYMPIEKSIDGILTHIKSILSKNGDIVECSVKVNSIIVFSFKLYNFYSEQRTLDHTWLKLIRFCWVLWVSRDFIVKMWLAIALWKLFRAKTSHFCKDLQAMSVILLWFYKKTKYWTFYAMVLWQGKIGAINNWNFLSVELFFIFLLINIGFIIFYSG